MRGEKAAFTQAHLLHQEADVVALDGAAIQGGAGVHSLHNCNRPGRGEAVRPRRQIHMGAKAVPLTSPIKSLTRKMVVKTDLCQKVLEAHTNAINFD